MKMNRSIGFCSLVSLFAFAAAGMAQTPAAPQAERLAAPPPIRWADPPLADGPIVLDTALERGIRLTITKGLNQPWSMAFLPDGSILVSERPGRLRIVRNGVLDPTPISGVPEVVAVSTGGLMDIALHPKFSENKLLYFTYQKRAASGRGVITLARGRLEGGALLDVKEILSTGVETSNAARLIFGRDGMLYMSVGIGDPPGAARAQDTNDLAGKVLRLRDDGTAPPDNPFVGRKGYRPEIFTLGHRNPMGLTMEPGTGTIWECEDGPNGGDEVNVLRAGKNYGWPIVNNGRFYLGPRVSEIPYREEMEQPLIFWVPAIAVSGITFYTGDKFPNWKNSLFVGGLRQGEVPRTGHIDRVDFNGKWEELHREPILRELQQRIRDVKQGPDGLLYVLTAENEGALIRIEPGTTSASAK